MRAHSYRYVSGSLLWLYSLFSHLEAFCKTGLISRAPEGQFLTQAQHHIQASPSVVTTSLTGIEEVGHTSAHFPHFIQRSSLVTGYTARAHCHMSRFTFLHTCILFNMSWGYFSEYRASSEVSKLTGAYVYGDQ